MLLEQMISQMVHLSIVIINDAMVAELVYICILQG